MCTIRAAFDTQNPEKDYLTIDQHSSFQTERSLYQEEVAAASDLVLVHLCIIGKMHQMRNDSNNFSNGR